jgi:hypothetical protein
VLLVLDVTPQEVTQPAQRVDVEVRERVAVAGHDPLVLEAVADGVHRLGLHALFVPVRPDQLDHARHGEPGAEDAVAVRPDGVRRLEVELDQPLADEVEVGEGLRVLRL